MRAVVVAGLLFASSIARAEPPHRGATGEFSLGAGFTTKYYDANTFCSGSFTCDARSYEQPTHLAAEASAGYFVVPWLSLGARFEGYDGKHESMTFVGAAAQLWVLPVLWVELGAGIIGESDTGDDATLTKHGPAYTLRIGARLPTGKAVSPELTVEIGDAWFSVDEPEFGQRYQFIAARLGLRFL